MALYKCIIIIIIIIIIIMSYRFVCAVYQGWALHEFRHSGCLVLQALIRVKHMHVIIQQVTGVYVDAMMCLVVNVRNLIIDVAPDSRDGVLRLRLLVLGLFQVDILTM